MTFGKRLHQLREEKKMLQKKLGQELGITARAISFYEADERFPTDAQSLVTIANLFNVSTDWLLGRTEKRGFENDNPDELVINVSSLTDTDISKIKEYIEMIKQCHKIK